MNINLHIERLVLEGVNIPAGQRHLLEANVTTELIQMLNNDDLAHNIVESKALSRLSTNNIQLASNKRVELGQQIAQSVYRVIGHE